ncbi:MAG: OsmC family protein [Planctomycetales bacterium]
MSVEIDLVYQGQLRCQATHAPSKTQLATDAPVDNHGRGESFSPTDLVATALGACAMTLMGIVAQRHQLDLTGTSVHVVKEMVQLPVRRIGALRVTITVPADKAAQLSPADRSKLETAALHCPVHKSLHPDIDAPIMFVYGSTAPDSGNAPTGPA